MNTSNSDLGTQTKLKVIIWNINGIRGKHRYIKSLLSETNPYVVFFSETKLKRPITPHLDIGGDNYDIVQLRSSCHGRGGMVALTKLQLQLELAHIIRKEEVNNFIHGIVMQNRRKQAIVGWYNSPGTSRKVFYSELKGIISQ